MVFQWNLSKSKSPQVSRTLICILADLNYAIVWMVSTCPLFSKSSSLFINSLGFVPYALITIGISNIFLSIFSSSLAKSRYLSLFSLSFNSTCGLLGRRRSLFGMFSLFSLTIISFHTSVSVWLSIGV